MSDHSPKLIIVDATGRGEQLVRALDGAVCAEVIAPGDSPPSIPDDASTMVLVDIERWRRLERAHADEANAGAIVAALGEGVCVTDDTGRVAWGNAVYNSFPQEARTQVEAHLADAFRFFRETAGQPGEERSRRLAFNVSDDTYYEMIASPFGETATNGPRAAALVRDASRSLRLQKKLDAIDRAGSELVRLETETIAKLNNAQRLALLEDKIIKYTRDLLNFDHFNIYLIEKSTNRLQPVMTVGMPQEVFNYTLYVSETGSGISGYVAATGKSYICQDVRKDSRYLPGLEHAASSLSVPLRLHGQLVGVFNIESKKLGAFSEEDRQFAEIFGRYVALALNILEMLVVERFTTSDKMAGNVIGEINAPLNDITAETCRIKDMIDVSPEDACRGLDHIDQLVESIRARISEVAKGPRGILGAREAIEQGASDPRLAGRRVLVVDDEANIRNTIEAVLKARGAVVTLCTSGAEAITCLERSAPGDFALIVSDISMPDRNGYEVFAASRALDPKLPVILITGFGYDPHHSIMRATQEGLAGVVFKPFQVSQLLEEIGKALDAASA